MLGALVRDLTRIGGVEVVVARDPDVDIGSPAATVVTVDPRDPWSSWARMLATADAVWPIAPETDGVLGRVTHLAQDAGRAVLNSRLDAVIAASSKRATSRRLIDCGIPAAPSAPLAGPAPGSMTGWVIKPDDGAGAAETHRVDDEAALIRWRERLHGRDVVVQPFISGPAMSLSLLAQEGAAWLLACNTQRVTCDDGAFAYHGGVVGGAEIRRRDFEALASRIAQALPGLWGYVGVDLVDSAAGPVVLEVNPRLTTSYVGLGDSIGLNPAALVLALKDQKLDSLVRPLVPRPVEVRVAGAA